MKVEYCFFRKRRGLLRRWGGLLRRWGVLRSFGSEERGTPLIFFLRSEDWVEDRHRPRGGLLSLILFLLFLCIVCCVSDMYIMFMVYPNRNGVNNTNPRMSGNKVFCF